jgi:hypothetical protein
MEEPAPILFFCVYLGKEDRVFPKDTFALPYSFLKRLFYKEILPHLRSRAAERPIRMQHQLFHSCDTKYTFSLLINYNFYLNKDGLIINPFHKK